MADTDLRPGVRSRSAPSRVFVALWSTGIFLGGLQAWTSRYAMNPDGILYLDNADAYFRGDFAHAVNTLWSPLYPWILGLATHTLHPTALQEFPLVHAVNFLIFLLALGAFQFFLQEFLAAARTLWKMDPRGEVLIAAVSSVAFLYAMLDFCGPALATPDLLVAAFAYLAAAWLLRLQRGAGGPLASLALGLTLGAGYLAKAPFFLYGLLCIAICWAFSRASGPAASRGPVSRTVLALAAFAAVAAPYIAVLSHAKGRVTFGDSAKYNLIWHVNGLPPTHWQGGPGANGAPVHPTHRISLDPPVYEFAGPVGGTYPPWYDAAYWNDGARVAFRISDFIRAAIREFRLYEYLVHRRQIAFVAGFLILFFLLPSRRAYARRLIELWPLLLFGLFPFLIYLPVHAESRYLAPFFVLIWTALYAPLTAESSSQQLAASRVTSTVTAVMCALMFVEACLVAMPANPIQSAREAATAAPPRPRLQQEIAQALETLGAAPGDGVAIVSNVPEYTWARLARVRVVAEVVLAADCGVSSPQGAEQWERARAALEETSARFAVSGCLEGVTSRPGWTDLAGSGLFALRLRP
ncbi:MAG TPA: hypothetical protein VGR73_10755 [Bryobacteraceae bacterium]|nr:hypothetical protein [Bryobacteraceae bacterium]